ncbi:hypothetical protein AN964_11510 [Heyndrickxia shackletonii]|uniref:Uncharacterized protein n=1 Tax=Heyndrickxia shackletonii TaxID=157838 RepID=A0A0Q3WVB9_9BACI|nr:hypothetical protein AN964_11510 [Heyndrickxia shackletonii]
MSFTQEQLDEAIQNAKNEWVEKELNPIITERDELLQFKPKDLSDEEKALQTKQQELFDKEIQFELKSAGLEQFAGVVKVTNTDELTTVIESLTGIVNDIKVSLGYIPDNHKQQNEYDTFAQKNDTKGMIATKLSKLFG